MAQAESELDAVSCSKYFPGIMGMGEVSNYNFVNYLCSVRTVSLGNFGQVG